MAKKINTEMELRKVKLSDLVPYENNPRNNDEAVEYVADSIKEFGFKVPLVIDKNNVIVAGHTRYKAAKSLGLEFVPCIIADDLTENQIKAFRLADNKVSDKSSWNTKLLLEELQDLPIDIFTGFDFGELFEDLLDEEDNSDLEEFENGVWYRVVFEMSDREKAEAIKDFALKLGGVECVQCVDRRNQRKTARNIKGKTNGKVQNKI